SVTGRTKPRPGPPGPATTSTTLASASRPTRRSARGNDAGAGPSGGPTSHQCTITTGSVRTTPGGTSKVTRSGPKPSLSATKKSVGSTTSPSPVGGASDALAAPNTTWSGAGPRASAHTR